jgi:hypothetical protein
MALYKEFKVLLVQEWYIGWVALTLLSFYVAFAGSYGYFILLGALIGIAQAYTLGWLDESKFSGLWLLNPVVWVTVTILIFDNEQYQKNLWLLPILLLPLNEVLLSLIFRRFSRLIWSGFNLIGYGFLYLTFLVAHSLFSERVLNNDAFLYLLILIAILPFSFLSGFAVYMAYLRKPVLGTVFKHSA